MKLYQLTHLTVLTFGFAVLLYSCQEDEIITQQDILLNVKQEMKPSGKNGTIKFIDCFTYEEGRMGVIVTFLAILEFFQFLTGQN